MHSFMFVKTKKQETGATHREYAHHDLKHRYGTTSEWINDVISQETSAACRRKRQTLLRSLRPDADLVRRSSTRPSSKRNIPGPANNSIPATQRKLKRPNAAQIFSTAVSVDALKNQTARHSVFLQNTESPLMSFE